MKIKILLDTMEKVLLQDGALPPDLIYFYL